MAQLKPLPLTVSCFSKIQISSAFLVGTGSHGSPGKGVVKWVCVCCVCVCYWHKTEFISGWLSVFSSWCNAMHARITADELARDVSGAEALISRHKENKTEIDSRAKDITRFTQKGRALIADKNFMASEVHTTQSYHVSCTSPSAFIVNQSFMYF